jgi:hypothetical protein
VSRDTPSRSAAAAIEISCELPAISSIGSRKLAKLPKHR